MNRQLAVALLACFLPLLGASPAAACSCVDMLYNEPEEAFEKSSLVFLGHVLSVEVVELPRVVHTKKGHAYVPSQSMTRKAVVTFRVERDWKGESPRTYTILAGAPPDDPIPAGHILVSCEAHFEEGGTYLVFASGTYPEANSCTPTRGAEPNDPFVERLNKHVLSRARVPQPAN
jgi:hypothetical protein